MTRDLLKNIDFIDILSRSCVKGPEHILSIRNFTFKADFIKTNQKVDFFSYAHHPWYLDQYDNELFSPQGLVHERNCLAIGETGLDRTKLHQPLKKQLSSFHKHIELSEQLKKPLIIHCVKAYSDLLEAHKKYSPQQSWIIHDFNQSRDFIHSIKQKNIFISLGRNYYERENSKVNKSITSIRPENIFFETDEMEIGIHEVYKKFCVDAKVEPEDLKKIVKESFAKVFMA